MKTKLQQYLLTWLSSWKCLCTDKPNIVRAPGVWRAELNRKHEWQEYHILKFPMIKYQLNAIWMPWVRFRLSLNWSTIFRPDMNWSAKIEATINLHIIWFIIIRFSFYIVIELFLSWTYSKIDSKTFADPVICSLELRNT